MATTSEKKTKRRTFDEILYIRMDPQEAAQVRKIASNESQKYAATVRKLIGMGLKTYHQQQEQTHEVAVNS